MDMILFAYRTVLAIYAYCVAIGQIIKSPSFHLVFFTVWSWMLLAVYFTCAAIASWRYLREVSRQSSGARDQLEGRSLAPSSLGRCNQLLLSTVAAAALMLDVVLWTVLFPTDKTPGHKFLLNFYSYNMHAANFFLIVIEILLNRVSIRGYDVVVSLFWPLVYSAFTIIRIALDSTIRHCLTEKGGSECKTSAETDTVVWPYFFMDTSKDTAVLWYLGLALLFTLGYYGMFSFWRFAKRSPPHQDTLVSNELC